MAEGITSLDLYFLVRELRQHLIDGFIRKIYQYGSQKNKQFLLEVFKPGSGNSWVYFDSSKIFIVKEKRKVEQEPTSFCMFLRKHLLNKRIRNLKQHGFDRILEISTEDEILVVEMFSSGNVILCDKSYKIIMPLEMQKWKDRVIKPKETYRYPPEVHNPFKIDYDSFRLLLRKSDKKVIVFLAVTMGLGSVYAGEICYRSGVDENKPCNEIALNEALKLHDSIATLGKQRLEPTVYHDFVSPVALKTRKDGKKHDTFSSALDEYFSQRITIQRAYNTESLDEKVKAEEDRIQRIMDQQKKSKEKWERMAEEDKSKAETIYSNYELVKNILDGVKKARGMGLSWNDIKEKIKSEETPEAHAIKEIREGDGIVIIEIDGKEIELDIRKGVEENAAKMYEEAKWAKRKIEGLESSAKEQSDMLERVTETVIEDSKPETKKKKRGHWYDKFRWFFSSEDFLVVGGKSAAQNENLIKKRTDPTDKVFHADIPGSAFIVIKSKGKEISEHSKREASEFAAAHSKAWVSGRGKVDVYCVDPEQVSKNPPPGQYLQKGSFMIYGEREWYRDTELKLAIGVKLDRKEGEAIVISGPVISVRKHADYFVTIRPGFKKSFELAKIIKNKVLIKAVPEDKFLVEKISIDEFQKLIPAGVGEIVDIGV